MGLYELAGFVRGVQAFFLAWASLALLLAWSRTAPARALRWLLAAVLAGIVVQVHWGLILEPGPWSDRIAWLPGLALCVATAVRLAVVTDSLGARWPLLSGRITRFLGLIAAWEALGLAMLSRAR